MGRSTWRREVRTGDGRELELRHPLKSDLDAFLRFANALVKEKRADRDLGIIAFDRRLTRDEERRFLDSLLKGMAKKEAFAVSAFEGERMVGSCDVRRRGPKDVRHTGQLGIVVLDGYRGVGVGEALMTAALQEARRAGISLVELTVFAANSRAIHLYEKMGFRWVGTVPGKVRRGRRRLDEALMYADLRKR